MAEGEVIVKTKIVADTSDAAKAEKAQAKVGDAAKSASEKSASGANTAAAAWGKFSGAVGAVGRAVGTVTKALGLVGFAMSAIETIVSWYKKLNEWLDRDKKAAEELARKIQDEKNKAAIEASATAYEKLRTKLDKVLRLEQERDKLADRRLSQERALEDAKTELEMQRELAGLDRDDPDYAQNAELVRSKYTRVRADREAERAVQDNRIAQARRYRQADEKETAANEIENVVYGKAEDAVIALRKQMQREKDPERKKQLESEFDQLIAEQQKRLAEVKKLRDEAASLRKEAENEIGSYMPAKISAQAVNVAQDAADSDTRRIIAARREEEKRKADEDAAKKAAKDAQLAADRETVANGRSELEGLQLNEAAARAQAQAAAAAYAKEQGDVVEAQNRYDMLAVNGGPRRERSAALAALQKEQEEANEAKFEMERVAAQLANTLQGLTAQIKAVSSAVQKAESRLAQNQADAPEG